MLTDEVDLLCWDVSPSLVKRMLPVVSQGSGPCCSGQCTQDFRGLSDPAHSGIRSLAWEHLFRVAGECRWLESLAISFLSRIWGEGGGISPWLDLTHPRDILDWFNCGKMLHSPPSTDHYPSLWRGRRLAVQLDPS